MLYEGGSGYNSDIGLLIRFNGLVSPFPQISLKVVGVAQIANYAIYLKIAMGSASEVEYFLILIRDLTYITPDTYTELTEELLSFKRMLNAFIQSLKQK